MSSVWDKARMKALLVSNDAAADKALMTIYSRQTAAEQASQSTREHNGVGFNSVDAEVLTSIAQFYERKGFLTDRQLAFTKEKITKYWRQLLEVAQSRGATVQFS